MTLILFLSPSGRVVRASLKCPEYLLTTRLAHTTLADAVVNY
jgi:hypothetical protein